MVKTCCAYGCKNSANKHGISFHKFPSEKKDPLRRKQWILAIKRENFKPGPNTVICSSHFKPEDYYPVYASGVMSLREDSFPSVFNFPKHLEKKGKKRRLDDCYSHRRVQQKWTGQEMSPSLDMVSSDVEMSEPELPANDAAEMGGCCAFGCSNSAEKGFLMKRFPADPIRRALWASKVNRKNWQPTNSTFLCEAHFTSEMFENNRADGRRLLKKTAVPTIFYHSPGTKSSTRKIPLSPNRDEPLMTASSSYNDEEPITNEIPSRLFKNITLEKLNSDPSTCFAEVLSNHGLMQQNEDFKFCLFLFHEMQFLSSNNIKNDVRKSIQQVLLQAFERDGQEI